jgi:hypothetical protein
MIPLTLIMLLAGTPLAEPAVPMTEEAINWDDYAPCGLVSLYLICQMHDKSVSWEKAKELVGRPGPGGELSFADLATAASQLGMHPLGLEIGREALDVLPMPAIIQVHDARYPDEIPHFLVLLRPEADGVWLLDAPYAASFLPEDRFQQSWTGRILVFVRDEQEAQQINGLAYGTLELQWVVRGLVVSAVLLLLILAIISLILRNKSRNIPLVKLANGLFYRRSPRFLSQTRRLSIAAALLFVAAAVSLLLYSFVIRRYNDMPPRCEFNEQTILLGEFTPGEHSIRVPIKNTGNHSLNITQVTSNCSCCAVVHSPSLIEPRQNTMLDVQLTVIPGPRSIQLTVQSNDPDGEKHVVLSWQGKAKPMLVPRWVAASNAPLDRPYERTIRLVYPGGKSALVPHLKSWECDHQGVEVLEGRNDPLATKFSTSGILTNILGEMELHLRIHPPSKPEYIQTICKLSMAYGNDIQTINLPLLLSFSGWGQLVPDVSSVTFSAIRRENLLSQERLVSIADQAPLGEISISDAPRWLTCEIHRKSEGHHLLRLKVVSVPSVLPAQHTLHITRRGCVLPQATLRIDVMGSSTF